MSSFDRARASVTCSCALASCTVSLATAFVARWICSLYNSILWVCARKTRPRDALPVIRNKCVEVERIRWRESLSLVTRRDKGMLAATASIPSSASVCLQKKIKKKYFFKKKNGTIKHAPPRGCQAKCNEGATLNYRTPPASVLQTGRDYDACKENQKKKKISK